MGVALVGLLDAVLERGMSRMEIAALANLLETEELKIRGGKQDQYAAACGGLSGAVRSAPFAPQTRF
mgnify:CR=1 FL=1